MKKKKHSKIAEKIKLKIRDGFHRRIILYNKTKSWHKKIKSLCKKRIIWLIKIKNGMKKIIKDYNNKEKNGMNKRRH